MATASLLPEKLPNEAAMAAAVALHPLPMQETIASDNQVMPAAGSPVGMAKAPSSQPQASFAGALHMTGVTPALPPVNWCLPLPAAGTTCPAPPLPSSVPGAPVGEGAMDPQQNWILSPSLGVGPTADQAQEGAVPSAGHAAPPAVSTTRSAPPSTGSAAPIGEGAMDPQPNWRPTSIGVGPTAAPAQEGAVPSLGPATATALMSQPQNWSMAAPGIGASAGSIEMKWSLPSKILQVAKLQPQDGCISRFDSPALPPGMCTPMVVFLGPLFPKDQRQRMEETKGAYVHNLILRAHRKEDAEQKLKDYLTRIDSMETEVRQRYDPSQCRVTRKELVEMMVLDGLFVIEVLVNHWMGKIEKGSASPRVSASATAGAETTTAGVLHRTGTGTGTGRGSSDNPRAPLASALVPQALRDEFTPLKVSWEPHALRFDLIVVPNQIPFFVLEELFKMTEVPELRQSFVTANKSTKLREIILDYLVGDIPDGVVLVGYDGPVYHILHLVYLHLTFCKEGTSSSSVSPLRSSVVGRTLDKLKRMRMDLRALCKRTFSRSSDLPVGWKQWKVIPPLRELVRVGVKLKRVETFRFADVRFRNGKLEIPAFAWRRYHIRLLTNLVVLEMSGWWPREKRLFCSYVMLMSELVMKKEDAALLFKESIVQENNIGDVEKSLICPILILADFSHGSKYECRFAGIVGDVVKCYQRWSKVGVAPSRSSTQ